jgi:hypothetical protein
MGMEDDILIDCLTVGVVLLREGESVLKAFRSIEIERVVIGTRTGCRGCTEIWGHVPGQLGIGKNGVDGAIEVGANKLEGDKGD